MKTTKILLWVLFVSTIGQAQTTTISLTSSTPSATTDDNKTGVRVGNLAGNGALSTGGKNAFIGYEAGKVNTSGTKNSFLGYQAGKANTTGIDNTFLGSEAGRSNSIGGANIFIGQQSGASNTNGGNNVVVGNYAGGELTNGNSNVYLGNGAGSYGNGSGNIIIGNAAGGTSTVNNQLFIHNDETATPLIWGDFSASKLKLNGQVGIGGVTTFPTASSGVNVTNYKLFVKGGILADEVRVSTTWADYVFAKDYKLPTLAEVEKHIAETGHLINVPSAKQVEQEGIEVGHMAKIQQEKIEELTLYIIDQNKINEAQAQLINRLSQRLDKLEQNPQSN